MALSYVTYNNIIDAFRSLSNAHQQVNSFGVGQPWDINTSGTVNYPMVWAIPQDSRLEGKVYSSNWSLLFIDLIHSDLRDDKEVISDMEQVALDFIAQLQHPSYGFDFKPDSIPFRRFSEDGDDLLSGVEIDITIKVPYIYDRCAVPSSIIDTGSGGGGGTNGYVTILDINGNFVAFVQAGNTYTIPCGLLAENNNQLYADI